MTYVIKLHKHGILRRILSVWYEEGQAGRQRTPREPVMAERKCRTRGEEGWEEWEEELWYKKQHPF